MSFSNVILVLHSLSSTQCLHCFYYSSVTPVNWMSITIIVHSSSIVAVVVLHYCFSFTPVICHLPFTRLRQLTQTRLSPLHWRFLMALLSILIGILTIALYMCCTIHVLFSLCDWLLLTRIYKSSLVAVALFHSIKVPWCSCWCSCSIFLSCFHLEIVCCLLLVSCTVFVLLLPLSCSCIVQCLHLV